MSGRRDCEIRCITAAVFDRSDQINQNSRAFLVPPRGAGQTGQRSISLRCRKIRSRRLRRHNTTKLVSYHCDVWIGIRRSLTRKWWSQTGSNRRHPACKAGALPAELWPHQRCQPDQKNWWARVDSNYRPHAYQACALTT